ncbi:MAG: phage holin family protein [Persicimonas sp.]
MSETYRQKGRANGLKPAFERLTDGVSTLVKQHLELARYEIKQDVSTTGKRLAFVAACGVVALIGYVLLLAAAILLAGWLGGFAAAFIVGVSLAVIHLAAAAGIFVHYGKQLKEEKPVDLAQTTDELDKDKQWLRKIAQTPKNGERQAQLSQEERSQLPPS